MTTSVIVATYNGERFIVEQLNSILKQSVLPDEVIICDDCSTDETPQIVEDYISKNNLLNWRLIRNQKNVGWRQNFMNLFSLATKDVVFCCDQDDIWMLNKIEDMIAILKENEQIKILASNFVVKYEDCDCSIPNIKCEKDGKNILEKCSFNLKEFDVLRPGCTMCFRSEIVPILKKLWFKELAHDALLWLYGTVTNCAYILNKDLIVFRRHLNNNTPSNKKESEIRASYLFCAIKKSDVLIDNYKTLNMTEKELSKIKSIKKFYQKRYNYVKNKKIIKSILLIRYFYKYNKLKNWVGDVVSSR